MPFMLVDDLLNSHAKARRAGLEAMGLWVMAGSYVAQQLTDGAVPEWFVRTWSDGDVVAKKLVDAGLWHRHGHDCPDCPQPAEEEWMFHQWTSVNPSREKIIARRDARKAAGQRGGLARAKASAIANAQADATADAQATTEAPATPFASSNGRTPSPSPSPRSTSVVTLVRLLTSAGQTEVTTTTIHAWAKRHTPDVDVETETAAFLDRNAGQTLHDPRAAWQAWMRKARPTNQQTRLPAKATTTGLPPAPDAPRCPEPGHEHELAHNCRLCASERLAGSPEESVSEGATA